MLCKIAPNVFHDNWQILNRLEYLNYLITLYPVYIFIMYTHLLWSLMDHSSTDFVTRRSRILNSAYKSLTKITERTINNILQRWPLLIYVYIIFFIWIVRLNFQENRRIYLSWEHMLNINLVVWTYGETYGLFVQKKKTRLRTVIATKSFRICYRQLYFIKEPHTTCI